VAAKAERGKSQVEREAAVNAFRIAGISDEIIEKAYPASAHPR
jgi:hypothetical protein